MTKTQITNYVRTLELVNSRNGDRMYSKVLGIHPFVGDIINLAHPTRIKKAFETPVPITLLSSVGWGRELSSVVYINSMRIFTAQNIENTILHTVTKTNFENLKVIRGRYTFDFNNLDTPTLGILLDFILKSKLNRVNYTWVPVLQDLYLDRLSKNNEAPSKSPRRSSSKSLLTGGIKITKTPKPKSSWVSNPDTIADAPYGGEEYSPIIEEAGLPKKVVHINLVY